MKPRVGVALTAVALFAGPIAATPFFTAGDASTGTAPSGVALAEIPADYLALYQRAAVRCPGLPWTVLAAVGFIESGHGHNMGPSSAGALGPMQFLPSTWAGYAVDGNGDGLSDIADPADAIPGAADYLCANGGGDPSRIRNALWNYNHSHAYVESVLAKAATYGELLAVEASPDAAALLANPGVSLTPAARQDLASGIVDARVVALLNGLASRHTLSIAVFRTGHSPFVAGTSSYSNHWFGRGVDIFRVDGEAVSPVSGASRAAVLEILSGEFGAALYPSETGHPFADLTTAPGSFTNAAHQDHIHIGWD